MSSTLQHCRDHVTDCALAIGASHMDKPEAPFWVANGHTHLLCGTQITLVRCGPVTLKHGKLREQRNQRRLVIEVIQGRIEW